MPWHRSVIRAMASPILGSKPYSNVHVGASITPSRLMNSCTRIAPTADLRIVDLGDPAGTPNSSAHSPARGDGDLRPVRPLPAGPLAPPEGRLGQEERREQGGRRERSRRVEDVPDPVDDVQPGRGA